MKEAKWRSREKELDRDTMAWTWNYLYLDALRCLTITELKLATYTNIPLYLKTWIAMHVARPVTED